MLYCYIIYATAIECGGNRRGILNGTTCMRAIDWRKKASLELYGKPVTTEGDVLTVVLFYNNLSFQERAGITVARIVGDVETGKNTFSTSLSGDQMVGLKDQANAIVMTQFAPGLKWPDWIDN